MQIILIDFMGLHGACRRRAGRRRTPTAPSPTAAGAGT